MGKRHCIGKVLVDATQDKSEDQYSEGDVEDELLAIVRKGRREEALRQDTRWPVLYHLSEERQNIVSWLPLEKTDRVQFQWLSVRCALRSQKLQWRVLRLRGLWFRSAPRFL